jgi:hypothetical protein
VNHVEDVRYVYPKVVTANFGDYVIDHAVRLIIAEHLPAPAGECDIPAGVFPGGSFDAMVIPGITHLTAGQCQGIERVTDLPYPTYCLSGSIWQQLPRPGLLLRSRVVKVGRAREPDLAISRRMAQPVGARDPYTYRTLTEQGIHALYTGCATLMLPATGVGDDGYVLFSLGRGHIRTQTWAAHRLARKHDVIGICHEPCDFERYRAAGWRLPLVTYQGDVELYLSYFRRARVVVTGRLHGALPGLAYGKKVFVFGDRDTRTTLLDDLGVRIHGYGQLLRSVELASSAHNRALVAVFRKNWEKLCGEVRARARVLKDAV